LFFIQNIRQSKKLKKKKTLPHSNYTSTENVAFCGKDTQYRNADEICRVIRELG